MLTKNLEANVLMNIEIKFGIPKNQQKNIANIYICFSRAAEGNLAQGQFNLGLMYDQGLGVEQDHDKALDWCRKAAYNGHEKAKSIIRGLQDEGKIVF